MSFLSAHVLDAVVGAPAVGVHVSLADGAGRPLGESVTDADGRVTDLGPDHLAAGDYAVTFATATYFSDQGLTTFFPQVTVHLTVEADEQHYHVPLLLSRYSYTTYRGS